MQAMVERDAQYTLSGDVHVDDAYSVVNMAGGKAGQWFREQGSVCGRHLAQGQWWH